MPSFFVDKQLIYIYECDLIKSIKVRVALKSIRIFKNEGILFHRRNGET